MHRRRFLQAMGLATGSLYLPSLLQPAQAAGSPPHRFLLFLTAHGAVHPAWQLRPAGLDTDVDYTLDLGELEQDALPVSLRPLHRWRHRVTVLDGLALASAQLEPGTAHYVGLAHALTGTGTRVVGSKPVGTAASIDQLIASKLRLPEQVGSLQLAAGSTYMVPASYQDGGLPLPLATNPQVTWDRLFAPANATGQDAVMARARPSVLDAVLEQHARISRRVSAEDALKLDRHAQYLRDLETRLAHLSQAGCAAPRRPSSPAFAFDEATFEAQVGLVTAAFSCDLTRVATVVSGELSPTDFGLPPGDIHDDYAHHVIDDPAIDDLMARYTARNLEHLGAILDQLDSVPEAGGTLLDHTTVVWMSEMANSGHGYDQWPVVVAGGPRFRHGRFVRYARTTPIADAPVTWGGPYPRMGRPHHHFLNTLASSFGLVDPVGDRELVAPDGTRLDLTATLPGLLL